MYVYVYIQLQLGDDKVVPVAIFLKKIFCQLAYVVYASVLYMHTHSHK